MRIVVYPGYFFIDNFELMHQRVSIRLYKYKDRMTFDADNVYDSINHESELNFTNDEIRLLLELVEKSERGAESDEMRERWSVNCAECDSHNQK